MDSESRIQVPDHVLSYPGTCSRHPEGVPTVGISLRLAGVPLVPLVVCWITGCMLRNTVYVLT